ncbi:MAG: hypothetical protein II969_06085 [Anaerolineaceae bacterium]|nr:hypothetical protein [Anaerolineaceae bacterium]
MSENEELSEGISGNGWLLDLYEDAADGIRLWFIMDNGKRICLRQSLPVSFYIYGPCKRLHECCLFLRKQPGVLRLSRDEKKDVFQPEPLCVLRVDMHGPATQKACFQNVQRAFPDLTCYNADLSVQVRHAAQYESFPMAYCALTYEEDGLLESLQVLNSRWDLAVLLPVLRKIELIPDQDPSKAEPTAVDVHYDGKKKRVLLDDAAEALTKLNEMIDRSDPDMILTEWGDNWLIPKLLEMSDAAGIPLKLNRDPEKEVLWKKETSYFSYGQIVYRAQEAHLFGRCHIDKKNAMMWKDYGLDGALEMARVTAMPIEYASRVSPGSGISAMQMITAIQHDVLVPEQKQQSEQVKNGLELIQFDRGGMIYQPKPGLYTDIAEIDFVSMYPAIIINGNISPEIPLPDGLEPAQKELGIVPLTLKPLYEKRVKIKQKLLRYPDKEVPLAKSYAARASALKWLLVVCFGFLGYKNARFGRIESHEAVTRGGREALLIAKEAAEDMGFEVLHMFVDALWLRKKGCVSVADFQPVLDEISRRTNMMIALDGIYNWLAFLPSRSDEAVPVPNRYFGTFRSGELKMRGIEARRHDMPPWIVETQKKALKCLSLAYDARDLPEYLHKAFAILKQALDDLNQGRVPLKDLVLTMRISRELEAYRAPTPSVRAAQQLLERTGKRLAPGQKVRFLYTVGKEDVHAWELPEPVSPESVDKAKYRLLFGRAAATILYPFGIDSKEVEDWACGGLQFAFDI